MEKLNILRHLMMSRYRRFKTRSQLVEWQQHQVARHLDWVTQHSPFYQAFRGKPLAEFPLMSKSLMMEHFNQLNTRQLDRDQLFACALKAEQERDFSRSVLKDITVGLSSGTSGQRGLFLASQAERHCWAGYILGRLLPSLWMPQRIALLLRANSPLYQTVQRGHIRFHYVDLTQPLDQWMAELTAFNPTLLVGSAQALQLCAQEHQTLSPSLVVSGAEVLTSTDRALLAAKFKCPIHEIYQCTEGFLACTQRDGVMRWNEDIVHIEPHWLTPDKTHFSPIITDFRRRTQPIIRYQLDDVIAVVNEQGSEHNAAQEEKGQLKIARSSPVVFQAIGSIAGRTGDLLKLPGANHTPVAVLPDLIYRAVSLMSEGPLDYRITQIKINRIQIESDLQHAAIAMALQQLFKQLHVDVRQVHFEYQPRPQWHPLTKQRRVVNLWSS
ncbi:CoF synthetase [Zooshikella marina]|uniref:F390 synthetase-related protein n=1 Tax=Zooshikella ganghwensis TaxID=202772 RepID=UPI001BB017B6|nr:F390 synthetase-related protein [Zooshikella ganghwensis]MBU2705375.1 CoF synthetase [Zooshikella ganghwensis]